MKKKVLHIGPSVHAQGGIATVIKSIIDSSLSKEYILEVLPTQVHKIWIVDYLQAFIKCKRLAFNHQIDIVHIHMASKGSFYRKSLLIKNFHKKKIPVIIHLHGACFREFYQTSPGMIKKWCRYCFQIADRMIVLTPDWLPFAASMCVLGKTIVIGNFVALPVLSTKEKHSDVVQILFMGRLGERKGIYVLLKALRRLCQLSDLPPFYCVAAGDGEIKKCESCSLELGISHLIEFPGWIEQNQKANYLERADIVILPSYFESFGLSLIEGMSYALPVIATSAGSMPNVVEHGADGYLVSPGNDTELSEKLEILIRDKKIRNRMGVHGRQHVEEKFSEKIFCKKMSEIYEGLEMSHIYEK